FAAKTNANFPQNPARGLPTIRGVILLCDADDGTLLAVMDSMELTALRTAAATAVAAKHLARADSTVVTIVGCGNQAGAQCRALSQVLSVRQVFAVDSDPERAARFAREASSQVTVTVARDIRDALHRSHVVVTCTPSKRPFIGVEYVRPGTFIAAVGADNP